VDQSLFLQEIMPQLCKGLDFNLFESELRLVREIEKTLDPKKVFEEKWNVATSGDRQALARYHSKLLSKKISKINESINKLTEEQYNRINGELEQFRSVITGILTPIYEHLKLLAINEQGAATFTADPTAVVDFSKLEKTASTAASGDWSIWGIVKSIGSALTGNYSILGIIQLVLDIIGLFGDAVVPGLGLAADLINALIYAFNGEYVLMALSLISMVPFVGDAAKAAKPFARPLQKILGALFKKNTDEVIQVMGNNPGTKTFLVNFFLPALQKLGKVFIDVGRAINGLARYTIGLLGYISGAGWIQTFFKRIDDSLVSFKTTLDGVDATAKKALSEVAAIAKTIDPQTAKKIAAANEKILKEGGEIVFEEGSQTVFYVSKNGKEIAQIPADKLLDGKAFSAKFPGAKTKIPDLTQGGKPAQYSYLVSKVRSYPKMVNWLSKALSRKWKRRFIHIKLGKWIYQYMVGTAPDNLKIEGTAIPALDESDYAYVSAAALTDYVQQTISQRKSQTGEIYNPTVVFNSMDMDEKQGFDMTQSYLRDMARKTGQPSIIPVIYDKYKNEMEPEEKAAFDETFASLIEKEKKEKEQEALGTPSGSSTPSKKKYGDVEIEGIRIGESYSRKNWTNPFLKFK
jgi:hypothetical protein